MAIPMTPSRFGSSFSGSQAQYGATAPSMADQLPSIDFGFDDLRERMKQFTVRFDDFIERGRKRVLDERNAFRMNVAELEESKRLRNLQITSLESKSTSHAQTLAREATETEEMHSAISTLTAQKSDQTTQNTQLKAEISELQTTLRQKREALNKEQRALDAQARHNLPELRFWEQCLGLKIEGTGVEDRLRFVYTGLEGEAEAEEERECWFELDMGGREYEVVGTEPRLDWGNVEEWQGVLNESRELAGFLKGMRGLFLEALRG